jgi:hypothetical protein
MVLWFTRVMVIAVVSFLSRLCARLAFRIQESRVQVRTVLPEACSISPVPTCLYFPDNLLEDDSSLWTDSLLGEKSVDVTLLVFRALFCPE